MYINSKYRFWPLPQRLPRVRSASLPREHTQLISLKNGMNGRESRDEAVWSPSGRFQVQSVETVIEPTKCHLSSSVAEEQLSQKMLR